MEINVNVKIDLSENTLKLLSVLTAGTVVSGAKETPVIKLDAKPEKPAKPEKTVKPETGSGAGASTDTTKESAGTEEMRLKIRTKVVSLRDAGHKDKTVELMTEYGITQLSKLPEDKLTEFLEKLNAIK